MGYYGNQPATGDNDSFRILDDLSSQSETFDASSVSVVLTGNDTLTILNHRFTTGQRVVYSNGGGSDIGGLADSNAYYVIKVDKNIIKLATSYANAIANSNIDLTSVGSGTSHTLTVGFDGINTRFVATYNNGIKIALTRAAQLQISINGVIQQPQDSKTPSSGFGIDSDSVIVFSVAPSVSDVFWGNVIANNSSTFDISDNTVDTFEGDGTTTDFNLSKIPANNQNILVTLDGVVQYPSEGSAVRAYSVTGSLLSFVSAPAGGVDIQVRHIGFAGATSSAVTGFYGRTGNTVLTSADDVTVNTITSVSGLNVTGGSVGIGTDNPSYLLDVKTTDDTTYTAGNFVNNPVARLHNQSFTTDSFASLVFRTGSGDNAIGFVYPGTVNQADFVICNDGGSNGVERFRITSSGNVGIGTDTPGDKLSIYTAPNALVFGAKDTTRGNHIFQLLANNSAGDGELRLYKSSATGTHEKTVEIKSTGNSYFTGGSVGIGTVNPPAKLSVDGSVIFGNTTSSGSGGTLRVVESGNSVYIQPGSNTSNDSSCDLIVSSINGTTEKLRIDSDGRVRLNGVAGVATFSARLHTNGNFHLRPIKDVTGTTPADAGVCIDILSDDNGTVNDLAIRGATIIFRNDSSETLRILSGGQVNIGGNYTQTTYTMQVTGTINATSNITQNGNALATNGKAIAMALIFG